MDDAVALGGLPELVIALGSSGVTTGAHERAKGRAREELLLPERILVEYSLGYERSADTAWTA
jgi:hypothetical protein